ncbi:hypothetical protein OFO01_07585 [Campylobacter sp. JMF_01 NE2]|uniref:hypothetical protein n=1 Tax=unclassified Campylobacter TaxID=2593542 RepID=UPI0022E9AADB|nr:MULTISPECIES: hypothetical protein [unclassified Campylobacter]MDA3053336.1 hypothetical protein [Campylobacter sp. JMF_03 NE3]MDA3067644.1 hypothetical protein [Campylobacter sp. JMF_01 NE2]
MQNSKPIGKSDDSSKEFIIKCLKGDKTYGFDIDSIYLLHRSDINQYYIFEYLKCESEYLTPHGSDPKYYPYNWRKFHSLFQLAKRLKAKLILVNYGDGYKQVKLDNGEIALQELPNKDKYINEVKLFYVSGVNYDALKEYENTDFAHRPKHLEYLEYERIEKITLDEFSQKLRQLNALCANSQIDWDRLKNEC